MDRGTSESTSKEEKTVTVNLDDFAKKLKTVLKQREEYYQTTKELATKLFRNMEKAETEETITKGSKVDTDYLLRVQSTEMVIAQGIEMYEHLKTDNAILTVFVDVITKLGTLPRTDVELIRKKMEEEYEPVIKSLQVYLEKKKAEKEAQEKARQEQEEKLKRRGAPYG